MARPQKHPKSGVYRARVAVPEDVRAVIGKTELTRSLGTKDAAKARRDHGPVLAELQRMIAAARAELGGQLRHVPPREVAELAGEVYRSAVAEAEANPGRVETREAELDALLDRLTGDHGDGVEDERRFDPTPTDLAHARDFLRAQGIAADADSVARTASALWSARVHATHVAIRRAAGDWSPDVDARRFPSAPPAMPRATAPQPSAPQTAASAPPGIKTTALLDAFAREHPGPDKTLAKRRAALDSLARTAGHEDAARITKADVRAWKEARIAQGRALKTVADGVAMLRPVWTWAAANELLPEGANPFSGMAPKKPKKAAAPRRPFTDAEATTILVAARAAGGFLRWLPWVLALTGCRLEEACGAVREDVREVRGVWCLDVREGADRALKTTQAQRLIPLHPALVAEGFVRHVQALPKGSPIFPDLAAGFFGGRGETATKRHGRWVRSLGIKAADIGPAHSWRHRVADQLRFLRVPRDAVDAILGHDNPTNAGTGYGDGWRGRPDELAAEVAKIALPPGMDSARRHAP
jgi:integrase